MKRLLFLGVLTVLLVPSITLAANTTFLGPIVPECARAGTSVCQACDLVKLADNLLKFMVAFSIFGAALMFAYAGFLYVTAATSKGNLDKARKVFSDVFIGLIIVLVAWIVVDLVLRTFTNQSLNVLTSIRCASYNPTSQRWDVGDLEQDQSVEPGGGAPVAGACTNGMTHDQALDALRRGGITVTSSSGASGVNGSCSGWGCTNLTGMCSSAVLNMVAIAKASGCKITVSGGTERGVHAVGGTHEQGRAFDILENDCIGEWLKKNGSRYGITSVCTTYSQRAYTWGSCKDRNGNQFYEPESQPHFHLNFGG